jgi:hypothetical protein
VAAAARSTPSSLRELSLGGVDLVYPPRRQISRRYLIDAAAEAGWLLAWASTL